MSQSNPDGPLPDSRPRTFAILFSLWLMVFTAASQTIIITPILPLIGEELNADPGRLGLLVSVYSWLLAGAALIMGPISDRIGRRQVLLWGSGMLAFALALHAFAHTFPVLLGMRALAGAAGGMLSGAAVSYVGDYFPYSKRGWATGWVMSGVPFGLVIGIPIGRVLAVAFGFRMPFEAFAVVMVLAFLLILTVVPQPDVERSREPVSVRGAFRRYRALIGVGDVRVASTTYFLMYFGLGLLIVYLPQWLTERFSLEVTFFGEPATLFGLPIDFIASLFFVGGIVSVMAGPKAGTLSDTMGRKPLILASCIGLAVVTFALTYVVTERWIAYPLYIAIMLLFAMRMSPLQALLTALVPASQRGTFLSLTIAVGQIGTGLGASLGGLLYADFGYRSNTMVSAATVVLLALFVWKLLPEPEGEAMEPVEEPVSV